MVATDWYEYVGAVHIHSTHSDGAKSIDEIIPIASRAGLDYILISDHMTLEGLNRGKEGFYDDLLVLIGYEIHDSDHHNHYLAFGLKEVLPPELSPEEYVSEVKRRGGLGVIAHPDEVRQLLKKFPCYPWTAWEAQGFDGIEIWNQMSEWMEGLTRLNILKMVIHPRRMLRSPTARILRIWDDLNQERPVVGLGGIDVHGYPYRLGPLELTIFPYKVQFRSIRTHLLLREPLSRDLTEAREQVYRAIRGCNVFISNYRWGDARGFLFGVEVNGRIKLPGEKVPLSPGAKIVCRSPRRARLRLMLRGEAIQETSGTHLEYLPDKPGNYRLEAYVRGRGWVFTNHLRLLEG
jgi:hypothetical protein